MSLFIHHYLFVYFIWSTLLIYSLCKFYLYLARFIHLLLALFLTFFIRYLNYYYAELLLLIVLITLQMDNSQATPCMMTYIYVVQWHHWKTMEQFCHFTMLWKIDFIDRIYCPFPNTGRILLSSYLLLGWIAYPFPRQFWAL